MGRRLRVTLWAALVALLAVPAGVAFHSYGRPAARDAAAGAPDAARAPSWGLTHTKVTPDGAGAAARTGLGAVPIAQNQAIMGWGVDSPEPSPGRYDFAGLDARVRLVRDTGGIPVITLCCSPDWMKGGAAGTTDWAKLETAPTAARYDDFAALAAQVARRYPDVRHYLVWNEFKGFFDEKAGTWDYAGYTALYNKVYAALKQVNPRIQVGGPYLPMNSNAPGKGPVTAVSGPWGSVDQRSLDAVAYWLQHKAGADFLAVDGSSLPEQTGVATDEFAALAKFAAVTKWLNAQSQGRLPVWWAEWYVQPEGTSWTDEHLGAVQAAAMMQFVQGGAAAAFYWSPQTGAAECKGCLWTGPDAGGAPTPTLTMLQNFARWFPPGTPLTPVTSSNAAVRVLGQKRQLLAVNTSAKAASSVVGGAKMDLGPYEVRWVNW
ncbi:xylan 1,4-beta-xylosidase [Actinomadura parmotrematis]|uniref:Xylan 1,4-beta-xylosidase n=1 Tax=Actinomadura parmotrematis TaxID=2864039 RepID=A0ABS7FTR5_9ACTN|nr:xylan 1,4-beta-xylosidase [Actinomadura parmotrematis]MBW8483797.1 xylan 1,4-beta-xylosidase [Actinomadura parmotrematis]